MAVFKSILYMISCMVLLYFVCICRKTKKRENLIINIPIYIMLTAIGTPLTVALAGLVGLKPGLWTFTALNLIISGIIAYFVYKKGARQELYFDRFDLFANLGIMAVTLATCVFQFGFRLNIAFGTCDAARHCKWAFDHAETTEINGMYLTKVISGTMINAFRPFVDEKLLYKVFIVFCIILYVISALAFYSLMRTLFKDGRARYLAIAFTLAYALGFPRADLMYGFVYLGAGITLAGLLIYLVERYFNDELSPLFAVIALSLGAFAIGSCYVLYAPIIYVAVFICICIKEFRDGKAAGLEKKQLFTKAFLRNFIIFIIPSLLVIYYVAVRAFNISFDSFAAIGSEAPAAADAVSDSAGAFEVLKKGGRVYFNGYWDFILFAPLVIFGIYRQIKNRRIELCSVFLAAVGAWVLLMHAAYAAEIISSYYFAKNHFLLSLVYFYSAAFGAKELLRLDRKVIIRSAAIWAACAAVCFIGAFALKTNANIFYIYYHNLSWIAGMEPISDDIMEFDEYVGDNLAADGEIIPLIEDWHEYARWFHTFAKQPELMDYYSAPHETTIAALENCEYRYIAVANGSTFYRDYPELIDCYARVYENGYGFVVDTSAEVAVQTEAEAEAAAE